MESDLDILDYKKMRLQENQCKLSTYQIRDCKASLTTFKGHALEVLACAKNKTLLEVKVRKTALLKASMSVYKLCM